MLLDYAIGHVAASQIVVETTSEPRRRRNVSTITYRAQASAVLLGADQRVVEGWLTFTMNQWLTFSANDWRDFELSESIGRRARTHRRVVDLRNRPDAARRHVWTIGRTTDCRPQRGQNLDDLSRRRLTTFHRRSTMNSITRGIVTEDSAATLLDRIEDDSGVPYVAADIASIAVESFDLSTGGTLVKTTTLDTATHVVALTTAGGWDTDDIGYNVRLPLAGTHWPNGDRTYRVEVSYTPVVGDVFLSLYEFQCVEVYGS